MIQSMSNPNGNIVHAQVVIRGTRPLWQHKFGPDALPLHPKEKSGVAGNDPEEWRKTCMIDPKADHMSMIHISLPLSVMEGDTSKKAGAIWLDLLPPRFRFLMIPLLLLTVSGLDMKTMTYEDEFDPTQADPPERQPRGSTLHGHTRWRYCQMLWIANSWVASIGRLTIESDGKSGRMRVLPSGNLTPA